MVWGVGPSFMSTSMPITVPPIYKMGCPEIHELEKSLIRRSTELEKSIFSTVCWSEHCGKILQEIQTTSIDFTIILTTMSPHSVNAYGMRSNFINEDDAKSVMSSTPFKPSLRITFLEAWPGISELSNMGSRSLSTPQDALRFKDVNKCWKFQVDSSDSMKFGLWLSRFAKLVGTINFEFSWQMHIESLGLWTVHKSLMSRYHCSSLAVTVRPACDVWKWQSSELDTGIDILVVKPMFHLHPFTTVWN